MLRLRALRASALAALLGIAGAWLWAGTAEAGSVSVQFRMPSDHGYRIDFAGDRYGNDTDAAFSVAHNAKNKFSSVSYAQIRGPVVTPKHVVADLGPRGSVDMTFEEKSRKKQHPRHCQGYRLVESGTFEGRFAFTGEHQFAESSGAEATGTVVISRIRSCSAQVVHARRGGGGSNDHEQPVTAIASCSPKSDATYFAFDSVAGNVMHSASIFEVGGRFMTFRGSATVGRAASFRTGDHLRTATVSPGAPFAGQGRYRSRRLTGNLRVDFLGLDRPVALTPAKANLKRPKNGSIGIGCKTASSKAELAVLDPGGRARRQRRAGYRHVAERLVDRARATSADSSTPEAATFCMNLLGT